MRLSSSYPRVIGVAAAIIEYGLICMLVLVRRDGSNSDCRWPGESGAKKLDLAQAWDRMHLSHDADFA